MLFLGHFGCLGPTFQGLLDTSALSLALFAEDEPCPETGASLEKVWGGPTASLYLVPRTR